MGGWRCLNGSWEGKSGCSLIVFYRCTSSHFGLLISKGVKNWRMEFIPTWDTKDSGE